MVRARAAWQEVAGSNAHLCWVVYAVGTRPTVNAGLTYQEGLACPWEGEQHPRGVVLKQAPKCQQGQVCVLTP